MQKTTPHRNFQQKYYTLYNLTYLSVLCTEKNGWLLSYNMWLYARVILECTGINYHNTPRGWLPKGKLTIKVLKQMMNFQRSTQLTKVTHESPQNSSSVFVSVLNQARNSDACTASQLLRQHKTWNWYTKCTWITTISNSQTFKNV